jgi:hypothetical protein
VLWDEAEDAIRNHIETQWALSPYSSIALVFENETAPIEDAYMIIDIEGTTAEKAPYGSSGTRLYIEYGIVYFHCFAPTGTGKQAARGPVTALKTILELQTIADVIKLEGANPPTPAEQSDNLLKNKQQPGGNYYRVSASVPFFLIGS